MDVAEYVFTFLGLFLIGVNFDPLAYSSDGWVSILNFGLLPFISFVGVFVIFRVVKGAAADADAEGFLVDHLAFRLLGCGPVGVLVFTVETFGFVPLGGLGFGVVVVNCLLGRVPVRRPDWVFLGSWLQLLLFQVFDSLLVLCLALAASV